VLAYNGQSTDYTYVSSSNAATSNALSSIANPDGTSQSFTYNAAGQLAGTSQAGGTDPVTYSYNLGEVTVTNAADDASDYYFDDNGELVKTVDPLGNVSFATYDSNGNLTSLTGSTGLTTKYTYDAYGNLLSSTDALGQKTTYTYTTSDNLLASVTNAQGDTTKYNYNPSGDLTSTEYPDNTIESATYDALGDPLSLTNQNGQVTGYTYNAAGQVASETLAGGATTTYAYNTKGDLVTATNSSGVTTLSYNSADELTGVSYPTGLSLQYKYNAGGDRTELVEMSGSTVTSTVNYSYNALGQLIQLTDGTGANIVQYTYNNIGELTREDMGDGTYSTYSYDADGNVLDLVNYGANGTVDSSFAYTYNTLGEETSMATINGTWTYGYDNDGELTAASFASTNATIPSQSLTYVYNAAGDRTQTIINGATTNYTSNSVNEYTTVGGTTYEYDVDGNLISMTDASGTTTYTYNSLNQLTGVNSPTGNWTYQYDAFGNLAATTINGQTTDNLVDPTGLGSVVGQYTSTGSLIASYSYGLGLVSQVTTSSANYYQFDALGSTSGLTNAANGLIASYSYLPFGGVLASTGSVANPFTFVGQFGVSTDGSGLYDMRARSYDPTTGQFASGDPLGILGDGVNLRSYVGNAPLSLVDPEGLTPLKLPESVETIENLLDLGELAQGHWGKVIGGRIAGVIGAAVGARAGAGAGARVGFYLGTLVGEPLIGALAGFLIGDAVSATALELLSSTVGSNVGDALQAKAGELATSLFDQIIDSLAEKDVYGVILPKDKATPTPPPAKIKCVPLSKSDSGYGFFSGSLGSTTMCGGPSSGTGGGGDPSTAAAFDPNAMIGPKGYGGGIFVPGSALTILPYQIEFENSPTATAPAQEVVITDALDANLNLSTVQLTEITFGDTVLAIPADTQDYRTTVPMTYNGTTFDVEVNASLNYQTHDLVVTFQSIDPTTQLPPDVLTGFLPPENGTGRGEGSVSFTISPNAGVATGTQIRNIADIVFDGQTPIATDQVSDEDPSQGVDPTKQALITIDNNVPTSTVAALPATESSTTFTVTWSGSDGDGSGIQYFNVYVSDDGGPYDSLVMSSTKTSTTFTGQPGHTYSFISIATSNTGITQPEPDTSQATTQILAAPAEAVVQFGAAAFSTDVTTGSATIQLERSGNLSATVSVIISSAGGADVAAFSRTVSFGPSVTSQSVSIPITNDGRAGESDVDIPIALASAGSGATLGTVASTTLVIHDNNVPPPPLVTVETPHVETIKIGKGKKAKKETVIVVSYSGALNASAADNASAYEIAPVLTIKASGKGKNHKPATTKLGTPIPFASASYTASNNQVILTPRGTLNSSKPEELIINAALVTDTFGREIDGNDDGQPGGDYIATINGSRVTTGGIALARIRRGPSSIADVVDHLLARGELANRHWLVE
jgi:RHS repeat-associated protein